MATAACLPIAADRAGPCVRTIFFEGLDLTGITLALEARLNPETPGPAPIALGMGATANAEGLRLVDVTVADGVPTSQVVLRINETTMKDAAKVPYSGELGSSSVLYYDLIGIFGQDKRRLAYGTLSAVPTVYGMDAAPASRPPGGSGLASAGGAWSNARAIFSNDDVRVSIDGADLVGRIAAGVQDAADLVSSAAAGYALLVPSTQGATVNDWVLTLPAGIALYDGIALQFDAPSTPDAVATGASDGIRILIGGINRGLYFTHGPAVDAAAQIQQPWRVFIHYYAAGNVFIFDRTSREALEIIELKERLTRDMAVQAAGADDARFKLTDYPTGSTLINTPTARRVVRPIASTLNAETAAHRFSCPGLRESVGINPGPNGGRFEWRVRFPGLSPSGGVEPMLVEVMVNGISRMTIASPVEHDEVGYATIGVDLAPSTNHLLTLMWPYGWAMEVIERRYPAAAIIGGTPARPARTIHFCGDSTSMPFYSGKPSETWWYKVAQRFNAKVAHDGYGGDFILAERGTQYAQQVADLHILLAGVNNATGQFTLQSTRDEARGLVQNFRAVQPNASLLVLGFLYQTALDGGGFAITGDQYRAAIQEGVADANGGANVRFVNAKGAIPNNPASLKDGTHPTDAMQQAIADFVIAAVSDFRPDLA